MFDRVFVVVIVHEIKDCEDGVTCVVVEDDGRTRKVLVLDSPETDVFLAAGDELLSVDWGEFYGDYVEIAELFGNELRFSGNLDLADVEEQDGLTFPCI